MARDISNSDDVIDSRDVIKRIEELEGERETLADEIEEHRAAHEAAEESAPDADFDEAKAFTRAEENLEEWDNDNGDELKTLKKLADDGETLGDWTYGVTLIRESYCQELVEDIGDMPKDFPSYIVIDWEATARNLRADYTEIDYDGIAYLAR